jgi:uncharacterized protein YceH (UPF0502 family)
MADPLSQLERRVLGVLVEKALTAAVPEPLTLNAVVVGSNQKSNRDPLMTVEEPEVDSALERLKAKGVVFRIVGGRTERWRHNVYDAWKVSKAEAAFLAELLLRGPQTAAEARARASRMEPIDQEEAQALIKSLVERGYVVWLTPENRRGATLTHGFHTPDELPRLTSHFGAVAAEPGPSGPAPALPPPDALRTRLEAAEAEIAGLRAEVATLRAAVTALQEALGVPPTPPAA